MRMDSGVSRPILNNLSRQERGLDSMLGRLATGQRINVASDDVAGSSIASKLLARVRGHEQASRNIADGISLARTADGALSEIADAVHRLRTLAVQAANASLTHGEREAIDAEAFELRQQIATISRDTTFNDLPILRGVMTDLNTFSTKVETFNRGRTETLVVAPQSQVQVADSVGPGPVSRSYAYSDSYEQVEMLPGWSLDDQRIEFSSSRTSNRYMVPSAGGAASASSGEIFTRDTTRLIGGNTYTLLNYRTLFDGQAVYDGLYVSVNGSTPRESSEALLTGNSYGMQMAFSNDGTRIAYTSNNDIHVASFIPATRSLGASILLNQDGDLLDVPQTLTLSTRAEWYQRSSDGARSVKVLKQDVSGTSAWISHDASHANGFDLAPDGRSLTLYGAARMDSNDRLSVYYQGDHNMTTDQDGVVEIQPDVTPEIYGLGTPASSVLVQVGGTNVSYDPTRTNGFDYDAATNTFRLFGNARPADGESVSLLFQADYSGYSALSADQDGNVSISLGTTPENWNLGGPGGNRAIRVSVGGTEVAYDASGTNGFSVSGSTVKLHGTARPTAQQSVSISSWNDRTGASVAPDGAFQLNLSGAGTYGTTPGSTGPRAIVVQVAGANVPPDPVNGYTYDPATSTLTLRGTSRPDVNQSVTVHYLVDGTPDTTSHDLTFSQAANLYTGQPATGSVKVERAGVLLQQGDPDGFTLSSASPSQVRLVGAARPDAGTTTAYVVHYTVASDLVFSLTPDLPPATASCEGIPDPRGAIIDEDSVEVTVNGGARGGRPG